MTSLEDVIKECMSLRTRLKIAEDIIVVVQRSTRDLAASVRRLEEGDRVRAAATGERGARASSADLDEDLKEAEVESVTSSQRSGRHASQAVLSCLSRGSQLAVAEESQWFLQLFPETCIYTLPVGATKSGRAPGTSFDPILSELIRRGRLPSLSQKDTSAYQAYAAEWPTLNQSITYQIIQAGAVSELILFVDGLVDLSPSQVADRVSSSSLRQSLAHLLQLQTALLDDQTKRGSVLIAAARKSVAVAASIANQFVSEVSGVHPSAEAAYASAKVYAESIPRADGRTAKLSSSSKRWHGSKPAQAESSAQSKAASGTAKRPKSPRSKSPGP